MVQNKKFNTFEKDSTVEIGIYIWLSFNKCVCVCVCVCVHYLLDSVLGTRKTNINYCIVTDLTRSRCILCMFYMQHNFYLCFIDEETLKQKVR